MKIVYNILGTYNSGGMERVLANKVNYLVLMGHEVVIVTTDQKERNSYYEKNDKIQQIDLGINYTDDLGKNIIHKIFCFLKRQKRHKKLLSNLLNRLKPDICISMFDNDVNFLYKIKDNSKKVVEIHFSRFKRMQYNRKGLWKLIDLYRSRNDRQIVLKYERFVVLTEEDKGYWGNLPNITVIPNANSFLPKIVSTTENTYAIAVGRYDYQKNFEDLINIWSKITKSFPQWKLIIYGSGPLKLVYEALMTQLGIGSSIILHQPVKNIEAEYANSSLLVMTSHYEGFPMALIEGQSCGLPLISYACKCGPKEIISDGKNGFLIPEGNNELFTKRLTQLIVDDNLRKVMGKNSLEMSKNYEESKIMEKWLVLFNQLINNK